MSSSFVGIHVKLYVLVSFCMVLCCAVKRAVENGMVLCCAVKRDVENEMVLCCAVKRAVENGIGRN